MKRILSLLLLLPLFTLPCYAAELDVSAVEEALPEEAQTISGVLSLTGDYDMSGALERLVRRCKERAAQTLKEELRSVLRLLALTLLCSVAESLCPDKRIEAYLSMAGCAAAALLLCGGVGTLLDGVLARLELLRDYARAAMPALFTAVSVSGAPASAAAQYAAVSLCLDGLMSITESLTVPLICAFLALGIARSIFPNPILSELAAFAKWACVTVMTFLSIAASSYISLTGALTGGADATAVRATKTVIASALPVVGGILSDAASTVLAAGGVIKNSAGVFALIGVCALCALPLAALGVKFLLFRMVAAVSSALSTVRLSSLLGDFSTAIGMMMGLLGSMSIMLFLAIMGIIKTAVH